MSRGFHNPFGRLVWPAAALALLLLFNYFFTPGFFHLEVKDGRLFGSLVDIFNRAAPVMLLALGMTLVIATAGVDLSVGAVMAIAGTVCAIMVTQHALPLTYVLLAALGAGLLCGMANGLLVGGFGVQPIVATLILMVAGRGIAQLLSDGQIITVDRAEFNLIGGGFFLGLPFPVTIVAVAALITWIITRRTALGLYVESVGGNENALRYSGINPRLVKFFVYTLSGVWAAVAGTIATSDIKAADANNVGLYLELDAILSVAIGGTSLTGGRFYIAGSLLGALLIQALTTTILSRGVPVEYTLVVKAVVIITVCLLQSESFRGAITSRFSRRRAA